MPYVSSVDAFNAARGPKGLLTVLGGDHGAPVDPTGRAFSSVVSTTTDFFDAYLKHDTAAAGRLSGDAKAGITTLAFTAVKGSKLTVARPPVPVTHLHATVTPDSALHDGQTVTVSWSGYAPGQSVNALECSHNPPSAAGQCDLTSGVLLHPDPTGSATVSLVVHAGVIGTAAAASVTPLIHVSSPSTRVAPWRHRPRRRWRSLSPAAERVKSARRRGIPRGRQRLSCSSPVVFKRISVCAVVTLAITVACTRVWVFPFGLGVAPVDVAGTSEHAPCPGDHDGACVDRDNRCIHAQYHRTERLLGLPAGVSPPVQL